MAVSPDTMRERAKAVIVVQATPFNADGSLDLGGLRANTEFLVDECKGRRFVLVPAGSTGEDYALSERERIKVIETVIDMVAGALPVVAGTSAAGTEQTIALSQAAEKAGADGVQLAVPYYDVPSAEGLVGHFLRLADALHIGVMIHNNPPVSRLWMTPHLMTRCAEHPNIVADAENAPEVTLFKAMRDAVDPVRITVVCGLGDLQFAYAAALGCPGFVSWTANLAPGLALALLEAADDCDFEQVREIAGRTGRLYEFANICAQNRGLDPWVLSDFTASHVHVGILKAALEVLGLAGGPVRGPGGELTSGEKRLLRGILEDIGLLDKVFESAGGVPGTC